MRKRKNGFTLIELVIGLSIQLIIMGIGIRSVVISFERYNYHKEITRENDEMDEAILTISRYINGNMIDELNIDEIDNKIKIKIRETHSNDTHKIKKIKVDNYKRLILESYEGNFRRAVNVILRDIEIFDIISKGELNYLIIKTTKGDQRIICL